MDSNKKADRRVRYTRLALRQSLLELMQTRPIEKITVKEICALADINRGTFYAHFSCPHDLLQQIENELYEELARSLAVTSLRSGALSALLLELFGLIAKNEDLCRILFSEYGDKVFLRRIVDIARDKCMEEWHTQIPSVASDTLNQLYTFIATGSVSLIQLWIQNGMTDAPETLATLLNRISQGVLQSVSDGIGI